MTQDLQEAYVPMK